MRSDRESSADLESVTRASAIHAQARHAWATGHLLRWVVSALLLGVLASPVTATFRVDLGDGMVATLAGDSELFLEAVPARGEGLLAFARRLTGEEGRADAVAAANGGQRRLLAGVRYRVPFELLPDARKLLVVRGLFPEDGPEVSGWLHVITEQTATQSLWHIARWFTGAGERFTIIRDHNGLVDETFTPGQRILIPRRVLLPLFRAQLPALPPPSPAFGLTYVQDGGSDYVVYRLKQGEALYSSVVVRFTGRTFAEDVNALAAELASLNDIADVTDMAIGQPVRIPFDMLLAEFLPPGHPRRDQYEADLAQSAQFSNSVRTRRLAGITVILDAGHGGQDPGTISKGVWESTYAYDIVLRIRDVLESSTAAKVALTTRDGERSSVIDRDVLPRSRAHRVLTHPPYAITDPSPGVHLRWYLANSLYREALSEGVDSEKVVFLSIHADALHPSLRGAMLYVPAASLTRGEYGKSGSFYTKRREVREQRRVAFSWKERTKSEGLSRQLADDLIGSLRRHDLAIHREKPIRDRIIRSRRSRPFVPAVVRHNAVPAKLLVEVCNLANAEDRSLIQTRAFRQRFAESIVDGILAYYGESVDQTTMTPFVGGAWPMDREPETRATGQSVP